MYILMKLIVTDGAATTTSYLNFIKQETRLPRKGFKGKFDSQKNFQRNLSNYGLRIVKC